MGIMNISETIIAPRNLRAEANQITQELDSLKYYLKKLNSWPAAGDEFLTLLPKTDDAEPITAKEQEWLHQVVDAAMDGTDIGFRYPAFFQKLLMNSTLRQTFIEQLVIKMEENDLL